MIWPRIGVYKNLGGQYRFNRYEFNFSTANRRRISASSNIEFGTFYSGRRRDFTTTLNLRIRRGLSAALTTELNRIELKEGKFSTKVLRAGISTQFSPWISISNKIQYDSVSRILSWQSRFRWIVQPGNDIYFVVMNNWLDTGNQLAALNNDVALKVSYTRRF